MALAADPLLLLSHKAEWNEFVASLPAQGANAITAQGLTPPVPGKSALANGVPVCAKFSLLATVVAFFDSVTRAITFTPFVSMAAIAIFSRSLIVSYAALYTLVAMVLTLLGMMHALSIPLGVTSALALSLVVGMSVDYIIHIAHAYNNSLFLDRFYKSRAAVFARAHSIGSAAVTTLGAVTPLLVAQLLPLREFGQIFALVTCVSLLFSLGFLCALMLIGPRKVRFARATLSHQPTPPHPRKSRAALRVSFP